MRSDSDYRKEYLDALRVYCWKHSSWDTDVVERYFQLLIDVNNPTILTHAVANILLPCLPLLDFCRSDADSDCSGLMDRIVEEAKRVLFLPLY